MASGVIKTSKMQMVSSGRTGVTIFTNGLQVQVFVNISESITIPAYARYVIISEMPSSLKPPDRFLESGLGRTSSGGAIPIGLEVNSNGQLQLYNTSGQSVTLSAFEGGMTYVTS